MTLSRTLSQPRYVIPLILLPFLFLFYFIFRHWDGSAAAPPAASDTLAAGQLNADMPGVARRISEDPVKDKFDAYREAYRHRTDFSMLGNIDGRGGEDPLARGDASAYSREEVERLQARKTLDSLSREMARGRQAVGRELSALPTRSPLGPGGGGARAPQYGRSEEETFLAEIQRLTGAGASPTSSTASATSSSSDRGAPGPTVGFGEQMQLFREQMRLVDSLQQVSRSGAETGRASARNDRTERSDLARTSSPGYDPALDSTFRPLPVKRTPPVADNSTTGGFHTLRLEKRPGLIPAMIDQDLRVHAGGRVRIRLLEDIHVGGERIPRGSWLYAQVTGFQSSRVNLSITQIAHDGRTLPVQLDVYDTDGYLGLYVPGSQFREFTKEIGTQGTRGLSQLRMADGSDPASGLLTQLFQTAGGSTQQLIRREKARLPYNYALYLKEKP
jgi:hypothetical protein